PLASDLRSSVSQSHLLSFTTRQLRRSGHQILRSSIYHDSEGSGGNAVSDDHKLARTVLLGCRDIEMSRHEIARCNAHTAVVMRPAIKHMSSSVVRDAHERKVGCRLLIVPVSSSLRHAVETMAGDDVRSSGTNPGRGRLDSWRPSGIISSRRVVNGDEEEV